MALTLGVTSLASDLNLPPQARTILAHLEAGKAITPLKAQNVYNIWRLSDVIFKIRNAGHDVITHVCTDESNKKYGNYRRATKAESIRAREAASLHLFGNKQFYKNPSAYLEDDQDYLDPEFPNRLRGVTWTETVQRMLNKEPI